MQITVHAKHEITVIAIRTNRHSQSMLILENHSHIMYQAV